MNEIWQILLHTPWWVFLIFVYLLRVGINATKPRIISLNKILILPAIFLFISINSFITTFQISTLLLSTYSLSLLIGIGGGWLLVRNLNLKFDQQNNLIKVPGSFTTLILTLIIFSTKYYFGYSIATNPSVTEKIHFTLLQLVVSGICTGLFIGRALCYLSRKSRATHQNLAKMK